MVYSTTCESLEPMRLNRRHKVGLFLTIAIVGAGLLFDVSVKESVGIALLGLAATWLVGAMNLSTGIKARKVAATALIALFSMMLLGSNAQMTKAPKGNLAYLSGQLFGMLLVITGLVLSIRWRLQLTGYTKTGGRQAIAIFLIVFCVWGLLLVVVLGVEFVSTPALFAIPLVMAALYIGGLYACIRWLQRLRKQEALQARTPQVPDIPAEGQASEQALTPPNEGQGTDPGKITVLTSHRSSWAWVIVSVVSFSALLGLAIFNLTWQSMSGEHEKAGESLGRMLIPLIALGYGARRTWKSLLKLEPEDNPLFQARHRKFNVVGGICAIGLLFCALGLGVLTGSRIEKNKRLDAILTEISKLEPKSTELRVRVREILSEDTPTFEDYYLRCLKLEKLLDEYDLQQGRVRPLMNAILAEGRDQPKLVEIVAVVQRINDKDAEVVRLFRLEIAKGKELITLPASQQASFYRQEIMPVEKEAVRIAEEEIGLMREAEQKGLKWPSDLKELLKESR